LEELVHRCPERNVRRGLELQDTQRLHFQIPVYVTTFKKRKEIHLQTLIFVMTFTMHRYRLNASICNDIYDVRSLRFHNYMITLVWVAYYHNIRFQMLLQ